MEFVTAAVLLLGGDSALPVQRVLPDAVVVRIRMLSLKEGMSQEEVGKRLGLKNRVLLYSRGTVTNQNSAYQVGNSHELKA